MYIIVDQASKRVIGAGDTAMEMDGKLTFAIEENEAIRENPEFYILQGDQIVLDSGYILELAKKGKEEEMTIACRESILKGFTYPINGVDYQFSYDYEAQGNFRDAKEAFTDGTITELRWTVKKDGKIERIKITKEIMKDLYKFSMNEKNNKISRLRDFLMLVLEGCTTIEDVNNIKW